MSSERYYAVVVVLRSAVVTATRALVLVGGGSGGLWMLWGLIAKAGGADRLASGRAGRLT